MIADPPSLLAREHDVGVFVTLIMVETLARSSVIGRGTGLVFSDWLCCWIARTHLAEGGGADEEDDAAHEAAAPGGQGDGGAAGRRRGLGRHRHPDHDAQLGLPGQQAQRAAHGPPRGP